MNCNCNKFLNN